jgi:hypothetical protein
MTEFRCPKTRRPCPRGSLCEGFTAKAKHYVWLAEENAGYNHQDLTVGEIIEAAERAESAADLGFVISDTGEIAPVLGKPADGEIIDDLPSIEHARNIAVAVAHDDVEKALTFPEDSVAEGEPYDEYYQREQIVCLRGTYRAVSRIFGLPHLEQRQIIAGLLSAGLPEDFKLESLFGSE